MSKTYELECMGTDVTVVIDDGGIEFQGWDEEVEIAAQALGLEPSTCWIIVQAIKDDTLGDVLVWAAEEGYSNVVALLLDVGADAHAMDDYALRVAAEEGHADAVALLLDAGANVHARNDQALRFAAEKGHSPVVELLLNAGANIHSYNENALFASAMNGHADVVELLLDAMANDNVDPGLASHLQGAALLAAKKDHGDVVAVLENWIEEHG
jgi:ankyrin repeat protein